MQYWPTCWGGWGDSAPGQKGPLTAMQIRLTVVDPQGLAAPARDRAARCDVLVTAPAGTALAAVASEQTSREVLCFRGRKARRCGGRQALATPSS